MSEVQNLEASMEIINIMITIDTDSVMRDYGRNSDPDNPTGIAHKYGFMVAANAEVVSGQGTGDLVFKANVGDQVRIWCVSASNNFDDAALVYGIKRYSGDEVFNTFHGEEFEREVPMPGGDSILPAEMKRDFFWFYGASVKKVGTEGYKVIFALYTRDSSGKVSTYGYYSWDPYIRVEN